MMILDQLVVLTQSMACTGWNTSTEHIIIVAKWARVYRTALSRIDPPCGGEAINMTVRSLQASVIVAARKKTHPTVMNKKVMHICMGLGSDE
jgi:hypothetical protein